MLLHEPGSEPPVRLCRALANKAIQVRTCTDAYAALGMTCRAGRESGVTLSILLLVEPGSLGHEAELVELVSVYAPKSVCWMYTSSPPEQVREVRAEDVRAWRRQESDDANDRAEQVEPLPGSIHEPTLRIVSSRDDDVPAASGVERGGSGSDDPERPAGRTDTDRDEPRGAEPVLTDEELAMLLSDELDEFDEHDSNGGHG